jgi:hypothetical protein
VLLQQLGCNKKAVRVLLQDEEELGVLCCCC